MASSLLRQKEPKIPVRLTKTVANKIGIKNPQSKQNFRTTFQPNSYASTNFPIESKPKSILDKLNDVDRKKLQSDLCSPSANQRVRAINACKTMANSSKSNKRYSMFDIPHERQELVTAEERKEIESKPKTIQEVMKGVVVFVEVRSGHDDRTAGIRSIMKMLGATVCDKINKETTHVIFKGGKLSTYQRAKKLGIPIVPIMWIEMCKKHLVLADPKDFSIAQKELYEQPELYKKQRRVKAMQPNVTKEIEMTSPTYPSRVNEPMSFHTPIAEMLQKELNDISNKLDRAIEEEKPSDADKQLVSLNEEKQKLQRRNTISVPSQDVMSKKASENFDKNIWIRAMANVKNLVKSPSELKQQKHEVVIIEDNDAETVLSPVVKETSKPKRRTLFTPSLDMFETKSSSAASKFKPEQMTTPAIESKPAVRRRTLFTPGSELVLPEFETGPKKHLTKPNMQRTDYNFTANKLSILKNAMSHNQVPQRTVLPARTKTTNPRTNAKVAVPSTYDSTPKSSIAKKRRMETEELKENTPMHPKLKKPLKLVNFGGEPTVKEISQFENGLNVTQLPKRRRLMEPMTK